MEDYRDYLRLEIEKALVRRPSGSIRNFARRTGFSHTFIIRLVRKEKDVSFEGLEKLAECLGLDPKARELVRLLFDSRRVRSPEAMALIRERLEALRGETTGGGNPMVSKSIFPETTV